MLKIAKVKSEKEFYKKYPSEEAFMKAHGKAFKKAAMGSKMVNDQLHQLTDFGNPPIAQDGTWLSGVPGLGTSQATYNSSTGMFDSAKGFVTKADTEALTPKASSAGGFDAGAAGMAGLQGIGKVIGGIEAIAAQKKAQKKSQQSAELSGLSLQAQQTMKPPKNQYVRPEDSLVQPGQLGNPYGTGTNYLQAQYGAQIGGNPTEIQNMYNPGDLYSDLGYEPLNDSNVKQFQKGGKLISRDKINIDSYGNQGTAFRDIFQNPNMTQDTTYAYDSPTAMLRYNTNSGNPNAYVGGRGGFTSAQPDSLAKYKQLLSSPFNSDEPGGMRKLASGKYEYGGDLPKAEFGEYFQDSGQAQIGSAVGGAVAQGFGLPPAVGELVGKVAGNLLGGAKDARKLQAQKDKTALNTSMMGFEQARSQGPLNANLEHGGWVSHDWQPQVFAKFGEYDAKDLLKPPHDADMLRAGGHIAQVGYTAPSAEAMFTGRPDMPKAFAGLAMAAPMMGLNMAAAYGIDKIGRSRLKNMLQEAPMLLGAMEHGGKMALGGELQIGDGGYAETLSYNPNLPGGEIGMFRGASHDNGGIQTQYGENGVEVEGGEPFTVLEDNGSEDGNNLEGGGSKENLVVFGNIKINKEIADLMGDPKAKGKKFKTYIADVAKNDAKQLKTIQKGLDLIEEYDGNSSYDKLGMNSGMANLMGAKAQQKINADKIKEAGLVQDSIHQTARQLGVKSDKLAEGKLEKETDPSMIAQKGVELPNGPLDGVIRKSYNAQPPLFARMLGAKAISEDPNNYNAQMLQQLLNQEMYKGPSQATTVTPFTKENTLTKAFIESNRSKTPPAKLAASSSSKGKGKGKTKSQEYIPPTAVNLTDSRQDNYTWNTPQDLPNVSSNVLPNVSSSNVPEAFSEIGNDKTFAGKALQFLGKGINKYGPTLLSNIEPYLRPSNANDDLPPDQLYPEYYAMAMNQLEPVQAQKFQPMLDTPYDISLNDQINAIDSQARAAIRAGGNNPAAQSIIMAQAIEAKNRVLGEQTRVNQANKMGVYDKNRAMLNDAQLKNLGILDQQYVRQSEAKSNTKAQTQAALSSIADKTAKQRATNRKLAIMENMYGFRFSPSGRAINMNAPAQFNMSGSMAGTSQRGLAPGLGYTYDDQQQIIGTRRIPKSGQPSIDELDGLGKNGKKIKARNSSIVKALKNF